MAKQAPSATEVLVELVPRLARFIANILSEAPDISLSLRQYRLLERLTERPHRTSELAATSGVSQPTASVAIASLESRGLVGRTADDADRRATLIQLTGSGLATFTAARRELLRQLAVVTEDLTAQDAAALAAMQPALVKGMDRLRDQRRAAAGG